MSSSPHPDRITDTIVQAFDRGMVECFLEGRGYSFEKSGDAVFIATLRDDDLQDVYFKLRISFDRYNTYMIKMVGSRMFPVNHHARMMMLCNTWNVQRIYPKAYAFSDSRLTEPVVAIILERVISLETGIHQRLLNHFTDQTISGAIEFWRWATKELETAIEPA